MANLTVSHLCFSFLDYSFLCFPLFILFNQSTSPFAASIVLFSQSHREDRSKNSFLLAASFFYLFAPFQQRASSVLGQSASSCICRTPFCYHHIPCLYFTSYFHLTNCILTCSYHPPCLYLHTIFLTAMPFLFCA